jgi:hypothetical protein
MSETPYLMKLRSLERGRDVVTAESLRVRLAEKRRQRDTGMKIDGMRVTIGEHAGWDHKRLNIMPIDARNGIGRKQTSHMAIVERSAAGVKAALRRMRPDHANKLAAFDAGIEALEQQLVELRCKRREFLQQEAWPKAHVVRLADVEAQLVTPDR